MYLEAATTATKHSSSSYILIIYVVVIGAFYFFYMRPRSQKAKAARLVQRKVEIGDRAQTIGGFVGIVTKEEGGLITLRADSGAELDFVPSAIAKKFEPPSTVAELSDDVEEEGDKK